EFSRVLFRSCDQARLPVARRATPARSTRWLGHRSGYAAMSDAPAPTVGDRVTLDASWKARVGHWFEREDMRALAAFLRAEKAAGKTIYPPGSRIFAALDTTPFDAVKVVILGQDPYHGPGQAHGLCFSVLPGVPVPPSLDNIFKEIESDLGIARPDHGCLIPWARQG